MIAFVLYTVVLSSFTSNASTAFVSQGVIKVGDIIVFSKSDLDTLDLKVSNVEDRLGTLQFRNNNGVGQYSLDGSIWRNFRQPTGNATAGNVLSGKTFANSSSDSVTGTMVNKGGSTVTSNEITESGNNVLVSIPSDGYYNTSSKISVPVDVLKSNTSALTTNIINQYISTLPATLQFNSVGDHTATYKEDAYVASILSVAVPDGYKTARISFKYDGRCTVRRRLIEKNGAILIDDTSGGAYTVNNLNAGDSLYIYMWVQDYNGYSGEEIVVHNYAVLYK